MSTAPAALKVFVAVILMFLFAISLATSLTNMAMGTLGILVTVASIVVLISMDRDQP